MGMLDQLLVGGTGGVLPGVNMNDPRVAAAVQRLQAKGVPLNRANIAEEMALGDAAPAKPAAPAMGQRTAPAGSAEAAAEAAIEAKRRAGPPAEMLRARRARMQ